MNNNDIAFHMDKYIAMIFINFLRTVIASTVILDARIDLSLKF